MARDWQICAAYDCNNLVDGPDEHLCRQCREELEGLATHRYGIIGPDPEKKTWRFWLMILRWAVAVYLFVQVWQRLGGAR